MIFGIDIKAATGFQRSGIGKYVFNFVENLKVIDNQNQYYLLNPKENSKNPFHLNKNFRIRNRYSLLNFINRFDVVHGPDFKIPLANAKKKVVNIHDLASFVNDGFMSKDFAELTKKKVLSSIKKADRILTISNAIKDQLESEYPETKGKITNIYLGVDKNIQHISDIEKRESTRKKYNLPESFILFVGNLYSSQRRQEYIESIVAAFPNKKIRVIGEYKPWYKNPLKCLFRKNKNIFTNRNIPEMDVNYYYNRAKVVLNIHNEQQKEGANPKVFEICGSGAYQICDTNTYIKSIFSDGQVGLYQTKKELITLIDDALKCDKSKDAQRAYQIVMSKHTFNKRIEQMLDMLYSNDSSISYSSRTSCEKII